MSLTSQMFMFSLHKSGRSSRSIIAHARGAYEYGAPYYPRGRWESMEMLPVLRRFRKHWKRYVFGSVAFTLLGSYLTGKLR